MVVMCDGGIGQDRVSDSTDITGHTHWSCPSELMRCFQKCLLDLLTSLSGDDYLCTGQWLD